MVSKDRIRDKLASLEKQLRNLQAKQKASLGEYKRNEDLQAIVERRLQNSIQTCIDIGMHVVTEKGSRKPETYADVFTILNEIEVIDSNLANKLEEMAGFRNVLAHDYAEIVHKKVYNHLQNLEVFEDFAKSISDQFL